MEILKGVIQKSIIILLPSAILSAFLDWKRLPLSIVVGGILGILNLRGLVRGVEGFIGSKGLTFKILFFSMIRLSILFTMILVLLWLKVVNVFGLLFGLTIVFILILIEGLRVSKSV
jgi:hypothetical protein